ncbi:MAG: hypothetical protein FJW30_14475 [Acidobacteria bacterium]|nr:hypothetical protein [Acidobacteriota bacterium]
MENYIPNLNPDAPSSNPEVADNQPKRTKTMSEAVLAANRANALKSTGPRTPAGKLKAASNSLKHGLYSLKNFENFVADDDDALAVSTNFIEQFNPVTPSEVALVHQLIHMQLRFMQMEYLYGHAMRFRVEDILNKPIALLPAILRELDRLPTKIQRTLKLLRSEIAQREAFIGNGENVEIEPIADAEPLPPRPESQRYRVVPTSQGDVAVDKLPQQPQPVQTKPSPAVELAKEIIADFVDKMNAKHGTPPKPPETENK